jgi:hypothetical protein
MEGFCWNFIEIFTTKLRSLRPFSRSNIQVNIQKKYENVYSEHLVIIYWGIETQMAIIMTSGVKHVIKVHILKVKVSKYDKI